MPNVNSCVLYGFMFGSTRLSRPAVRDVAEVDLLDERARAAARRRAVAVDRRPVVVVERPVVADPAVGAARAARHLELLDVVEHAPRSVRLPLAVALEVVGEADPRRDLVAEAELDARVLLAVGRDVRLVEAHAVVDRQLLVDRPLVLSEQPDVVRVDVADRVDACGSRSSRTCRARSCCSSVVRVAFQLSRTFGNCSPLLTALPNRSSWAPTLTECWPFQLKNFVRSPLTVKRLKSFLTVKVFDRLSE